MCSAWCAVRGERVALLQKPWIIACLPTTSGVCLKAAAARYTCCQWGRGELTCDVFPDRCGSVSSSVHVPCTVHGCEAAGRVDICAAIELHTAWFYISFLPLSVKYDGTYEVRQHSYRMIQSTDTVRSIDSVITLILRFTAMYVATRGSKGKPEHLTSLGALRSDASASTGLVYRGSPVAHGVPGARLDTLPVACASSVDRTVRRPSGRR